MLAIMKLLDFIGITDSNLFGLVVILATARPI